MNRKKKFGIKFYFLKKKYKKMNWEILRIFFNLTWPRAKVNDNRLWYLNKETITYWLLLAVQCWWFDLGTFMIKPDSNYQISFIFWFVCIDYLFVVLKSIHHNQCNACGISFIFQVGQWGHVYVMWHVEIGNVLIR